MPSFAVSLLEWTQLFLRRIHVLASLQKQLLTAFAVLTFSFLPNALQHWLQWSFLRIILNTDLIKSAPMVNVCSIKSVFPTGALQPFPVWLLLAFPTHPAPPSLSGHGWSSHTGLCGAPQTSQTLHLCSDQFFLVSSFLLLVFEIINDPASWNQFFLTWAPIAMTYFQHAVSTLHSRPAQSFPCVWHGKWHFLLIYWKMYQTFQKRYKNMQLQNHAMVTKFRLLFLRTNSISLHRWVFQYWIEVWDCIWSPSQKQFRNPCSRPQCQWGIPKCSHEKWAGSVLKIVLTSLSSLTLDSRSEAVLFHRIISSIFPNWGEKQTTGKLKHKIEMQAIFGFRFICWELIWLEQRAIKLWQSQKNQ